MLGSSYSCKKNNHKRIFQFSYSKLNLIVYLVHYKNMNSYMYDRDKYAHDKNTMQWPSKLKFKLWSYYVLTY